MQGGIHAGPEATQEAVQMLRGEGTVVGREGGPRTAPGMGAAADAPQRPRGNIIVRQKLNYEIRKQ